MQEKFDKLFKEFEEFKAANIKQEGDEIEAASAEVTEETKLGEKEKVELRGGSNLTLGKPV